jgi:small subunit ribosomal protein S21
MIIINVRDDETIDRALKRYKRKHRDTRIVNELRDRKHFTKKSIKRRKEKLSAIYREKKYSEN